MPINQVQPGQITSELQAIFTSLNSLLDYRVKMFAEEIYTIGLSGLEGPPYGFSAADANDIYAAVTDLYNLHRVWDGDMYVAPGAAAGAGVPTLNTTNAFGYIFRNNPSKTAGMGY
jgi:hypothetical protein